ncbi:site-specific integrase [Sporosarcina sp. ACRSM]|uniref:tyrosine-type recombinase/integrase n=1 Tax=Sporosarcina sp. ACRSM TaxID=2918216 RepID=UPI001EF5188E|nr:tyrosine-type recombinase/integrase [Sporosarcina sp. ACRSM]MCG7337171.1 site-specific integrase [Sporosarcina sp. ACRSM]
MGGYGELNDELLKLENRKMINEFVLSLREKNRSVETIRRHRGTLHHFFVSHQKTYTSVTREDIESWLREQRKNRTERTVGAYLITLRTFYSFCVVEKQIEASPLQDNQIVNSSPEMYWELKKSLPNQENQHVINTFLFSLKKLDRSEKTIVCKRVFLQNFFKAFEKSFDSITLEEINHWLTKNRNTWNKDTLRGILSALRLFYEFCWEEGLMKNPPLRNKRRFKEVSENYWEIQIRLPNEENKKVINAFLLHLKNRNRNKRTIEDYRTFLQLFFKYIHTHFSLIETNDIQQWFENHQKDLKDRTKVSNMSILRSFYTFCVRKDYLDTSPVKYKWEKEDAEKYWELSKPIVNQENQEVIHEFLLSIRVANLSPQTIYQYKFFLEKFFGDRQEQFSNLTPDDIQEWLIQQQQNLKVSTIRYRIGVLASFYTFCVDEGYMEKIPIKRRWYPRLPKPVPKYLEKPEIAKVRQVCEKQNLRNRVIVEFLLTSGCRIGEVHQLNKKDVDLEQRTARVTGKGNKIREVHFSETCAILLERYLETADAEHPALFVSDRGTRLSIRSKQGIVEQIGQKAGVVGKLHPHRMRHTFATELLTKGAELSFIADELGHTNLQTTKIYARMPKWKLLSLYRMYMG